MGTKKDGLREDREGFKNAKEKVDFEAGIDKKEAAVEAEKFKKQEKRENREKEHKENK
ncbi:hypothetical protein [Latilactobacillus curvatus]|uniref:hypothetical protein n=1 Tax=Latilactobacillus curvatus TaxID=28038 RepID=UPI0012FE6D94|nr:hypothetical protein [Latilactobacillus curvatus]